MLFVVKHGTIAKQYAQQCASFAGLDFLERSIRQVDLDLKRIAQGHEEIPIAIDDLNQLSRQYGSYVGEVFRIHHGGAWGAEESLRKEDTLGIQKGTKTFWPWHMCLKVLLNPSDTILLYYGHMVGDEGYLSREE